MWGSRRLCVRLVCQRTHPDDAFGVLPGTGECDAGSPHYHTPVRRLEPAHLRTRRNLSLAAPAGRCYPTAPAAAAATGLHVWMTPMLGSRALMDWEAAVPAMPQSGHYAGWPRRGATPPKCSAPSRVAVRAFVATAAPAHRRPACADTMAFARHSRTLTAPATSSAAAAAAAPAPRDSPGALSVAARAMHRTAAPLSLAVTMRAMNERAPGGAATAYLAVGGTGVVALRAVLVTSRAVAAHATPAGLRCPLFCSVTVDPVGQSHCRALPDQCRQAAWAS